MARILWLLITLPLQLQNQHRSESLVIDNIASRQLQQQHWREPLLLMDYSQTVASAACEGSSGCWWTTPGQLQQQHGRKPMAVN